MTGKCLSSVRQSSIKTKDKWNKTKKRVSSILLFATNPILAWSHKKITVSTQVWSSNTCWKMLKIFLKKTQFWLAKFLKIYFQNTKVQNRVTDKIAFTCKSFKKLLTTTRICQTQFWTRRGENHSSVFAKVNRLKIKKVESFVTIAQKVSKMQTH